MNINKKKEINEIFYLTLLFLIFLLILTPGNFGEIFDAETWKAWSASRILIYHGEFIQLSFGPLYYLLLTIFSPLNYKYSIYLEYFFSHLFFFLTTYYLFKIKNLQYFAIIFLILSIPSMAFIQSPKYLVAASFLNLHLISQYKNNNSTMWFPKYLIFSLLCNWGYIVFYIGHFLIKFYISCKKINTIKITKPSIVGIFFIILIFSTFIFKGDKFYNNHFVSNYNEKFLPIDLKSPFQIGFFQFGNNNFNIKNIDKEKLYKADWYFTHNKNYGNCKTVLCVAINDPKILLNTLIENPGGKLRSLSSVFFSKNIITIDKKIFIPLLILLFFFIFIGLQNFYRKNKSNTVYLCSVLIGTIGYILALSLTKIGFRYAFPLMPIAFLILLYVNDNSKKFNFTVKNIGIFHVLILLILFYFNLNNFYKNPNYNQFFKSSSPNSQITNYFYSEKEVFTLINENQKIFTTDDNWLTGFSEANPKNVYGIFSLPPIVDGKTIFFLDSFDLILLNNNINKKKSSVATQSFLRHELHLEKFLLNTKEKWDIYDIQFYGKAYVKRK